MRKMGRQVLCIRAQKSPMEPPSRNGTSTPLLRDVMFHPVAPKPSSTSPDQTHAVFIVTYARGNPTEPGGSVKPYHWIFLIQAYTDSHRMHKGIVHQLRGGPGAFHYQGDETAYIMHRLGKAINKVEVGSVESSKLRNIAEILNRVPIVQNEHSSWNCQDWSARGLELMRKWGVVGDRREDENNM